MGYKAVNVPLVPGIDPPKELFELDRWRIVGLTMDAERLLKIRGQRVRGMGGFGTKDGYADLVKIYDELDEIGKVQKRLGCPIVDTTGVAIEEAASRIIDMVDERAKKVGARLRRPPGIVRAPWRERPGSLPPLTGPRVRRPCDRAMNFRSTPSGRRPTAVGGRALVSGLALGDGWGHRGPQGSQRRFPHHE